MRDKQNSHPRLSHTARTRDPQRKWPGCLLQHDPRSAPQRSSTVLGGFFLKHGAQADTPFEHFAIAYKTRSREKRGVHLTAGVNPYILSALGNVLPKLSLFSLSLHYSKIGHIHPSIGYHKAKILDIFFRESSHNTLEMTRPRITGTTTTRTTADSDFRPLGIRRRSTLELESYITRLGHPQQPSNCPNSETSLRQVNALQQEQSGTPRDAPRRRTHVCLMRQVVLSRRRKSSRDEPHHPNRRCPSRKDK
ncbi:hypothetical protein CDL15_Pgr024813 [Punica granatum]|uniref:Uncharacterized protein n=1 Tax=Punica granatum TaxID=22663 RepID=A0A218WKJ2_PUNGR|nr:hypothetical protein CDL15_Pgr024813 [Punica granatum]